MVRINARIGKTLNDWLDVESAKTGVPKSTLIHLALEQYINQKEALNVSRDIFKLLEGVAEGFENLEKKVEELSKR